MISQLVGDMKTDRFSLTWKDYQNCTSNSFRGFIERQEFVDVTIACDDTNQIQAHKVILSACSDFFKNILLKYSSQLNPLLYLDNVSYEDLKNVISFIYFGETAVCQEEFPSFLKAAKKLKVKGLSDQYCQEVPNGESTDNMIGKRKRGTKRARYKSMVKKELSDSVKYMNVVDAITKSIEACENQTLTESSSDEETDDDGLFVDVENEAKTEDADIDQEEIMIDNNDEESDDDSTDNADNDAINGDNETYIEQDEMLAAIEYHIEKDEQDEKNGEENEYLPNEDEIFSDSDSEQDYDDEENDDSVLGDIEHQIELEDVMEHINEDDEWNTLAVFKEENKEEIKNEISSTVVETEEDLLEEEEIPLSKRIRKRRETKRLNKRNNKN